MGCSWYLVCGLILMFLFFCVFVNAQFCGDVNGDNDINILDVDLVV